MRVLCLAAKASFLSLAPVFLINLNDCHGLLAGKDGLTSLSVGARKRGTPGGTASLPVLLPRRGGSGRSPVPEIAAMCICLGARRASRTIRRLATPSTALGPWLAYRPRGGTKKLERALKKSLRREGTSTSEPCCTTALPHLLGLAASEADRACETCLRCLMSIRLVPKLAIEWA